MEGVISVLRNHKLKLHTTRSWDFMGLTRGKLGSPQEGDVIIGLIDSGYYIKHTIITILFCINNQMLKKKKKFTSIVLQESGPNRIASTMKGSALHLVNGRVYAKCQLHLQQVSSLSPHYLCEHCHGSKHH